MSRMRDTTRPTVERLSWDSLDVRELKKFGWMHRKRYARMKARALALEMDLPPKHRGKTVDYRNLVYYLP